MKAGAQAFPGARRFPFVDGRIAIGSCCSAFCVTTGDFCTWAPWDGPCARYEDLLILI
jgi:hypothetical protein